MFKDYVLKYLNYDHNNRLVIIDNERIYKMIDYIDVLKSHGFNVIHYTDDLFFRIHHEEKYKDSFDKSVIVVKESDYVPYDILSIARIIDLSINCLFPRLDAFAITDSNVDLDLLVCAYNNAFVENSGYQKTKEFISNVVLSKENVSRYINYLSVSLQKHVNKATYKEWFESARIKALIKLYALSFGLPVPDDNANSLFRDYVLSYFSKLSSIISDESPVLVSKAMDFITNNSNKFALIVMDGMSVFDWKIISDSFAGMIYNESNAFAMIPTITSISRQCLLSNKYPVQLENPWSQSKEKREFIDCAKNLGYQEHEISYQRGYEVVMDPNFKCMAIIINDIDDMVHGQQQAEQGMFNDISLMARQGNLAKLTKDLLNLGFDVYISADHGNVACTGIGGFKTGVETETKSRRMLVLKDIADKGSLLSKYPLIEFPKYYLDKQYDYLICDNRISFDNKGNEVMTHGGISIEEVIVPFVILKAGENNG